MEQPRPGRTILRLVGISMSDVCSMEDAADTRFQVGVDDATPVRQMVYDKIPRLFTGLGEWVQHTNLHCWGCGFCFDGRPKFVPTYIREGDGGAMEIGVLGNMCSFACAERWIVTRVGDGRTAAEKWKLQNNLCRLHQIFTGRLPTRIIAAPCITELCSYGGDMDDATFRRTIRTLSPPDNGPLVTTVQSLVARHAVAGPQAVWHLTDRDTPVEQLSPPADNMQSDDIQPAECRAMQLDDELQAILDAM
jgi:hypothetical protein